jgi:hypothetical protein
MGTGFIPEVKRPGTGVDHEPNLAPRLKKEYIYTSSSALGLRGLFWCDFAFVKVKKQCF